jgi:Tol biopolymer transport system component
MVTGSRHVLYPDPSPDGRWVAFSLFFQGGQADLAVVGTDGTGFRQLTDERHFGNYWPRWSRTEAGFYSDRSGTSTLEHSSDGSGLRQLTSTVSNRNHVALKRTSSIGLPTAKIISSSRSMMSRAEKLPRSGGDTLIYSVS